MSFNKSLSWVAVVMFVLGVVPSISFAQPGAFGGGYGPLCGRYGLALDNIVAAEVVLSDGRIVPADATENAEITAPKTTQRRIDRFMSYAFPKIVPATRGQDHSANSFCLKMR